jgi:Zn-dependent M28 family amino/carboxypeptidase
MGFGMVDSANNINDYEGIDVSGKTVLVLRGIPEGYTGSRRSAWTLTKSRAAQKAGAVGCIIIYSAKTMQAWGQEIEEAKKEKIGRIDSRKNINTIILDSLSTKELFKMPAKSYADLRNELENGLIENGTVLDETISWQLKQEKHEHTARNVIAILKGNDPALANEYVSIGAHYDHVGIRNGQVHNGADDNASGTTATLECARELARGNTNRRPILFFFWDAEEKGLLGSEYYASTHENLSDIVVNINLDMVGRQHEDSLAVIGSGKLSSEFYHIVDKINKQTSNFIFDYTYDDENHPEHFYRRSDQWNFIKRGVPAVFFFDSENNDYHTPRDDADKINYLKMKKVVNLAIAVALEVANLDHKLVIDKANISGKDVKK